MRIMAAIAVVVLCLMTISPSVQAQPKEMPLSYRIGPVFGIGNLISAEDPNYSFDYIYGFAVSTGGNGPTEGFGGGRFSLGFSLLFQNNYSDSTTSSNFGFFAGKDNAEFKFSAVRAGFDLEYRLSAMRTLTPKISIGVGYMIWEYTDPAADTIIKVESGNGTLVDFNAAEMYISGGLGLEIRPARHLVFDLKATADYLTGLGTDFASEVDNDRAKILLRASLTVSLLFGKTSPKTPLRPVWPSDTLWSGQVNTTPLAPPERDSDGDGIIDKRDDCPNTPQGAYVDDDGCPFDSDGDGVFDGLDDCADTPPQATGFVDIYGCPIDTDFDGVPDYIDVCDGPIGAAVDRTGCPTDSDGDGVYDGLDDCPDSDTGIMVDQRGCIDVEFLKKPYVVHVDYLPGSFEVDVRTKKRMQPLIRNLKILNHVKIRIIGYTDNVGPAEANQDLSQKRSNRMRDWLETEGIARDRMEPIGRGETNFIATNRTAEGRAMNRRIELVFEAE